MTTLRLAIVWGTVALFALAGGDIFARMEHPLVALAVFVLLLGTIVWAAFGVVHKAERLAVLMGEPYGTLVLTLAIVIMEVGLVAVVMLSSAAAPTLGRDTMYAVLMIVITGIFGLGLILGGMKHHRLSYNVAGAKAFLTLIIPLSVIGLMLPNFTTTTAPGTLSATQSVIFALATLAMYVVFLFVQTVRHSDFFMLESEMGAHHHSQDDSEGKSLGATFILLIAHIVPIIILSKSLARVLDYGIEKLGAPVELGGVLIAMIILMPEGIAAVRAISSNALQRAVNLCFGASASTLGMTVPVVLFIGLLTGQEVTLGLSQPNMLMLATSLIVSVLTLSGERTTVLEGAVHLSLFGVFLVLIFSP